MNMILNPAGMLEKNDAAKNLFAEYLTPMTFQNVTEAEARAILEYLRQQDQKPKP
jgi:cytochrome c1